MGRVRLPRPVALCLVWTVAVAGATGASAADAPGPDPFAPPVTPPPASGLPVRVRHDLSGDPTFRVRGPIESLWRVAGTMPEGKQETLRAFVGSVDLVRRVRLAGGKRRSTVEGTLDLVGRFVEGATTGGEPKDAKVPLTLSWEESGAGDAVLGTVRLEAPGLSPDDLEALQRAFTDRLGPPDVAVRVGDVFEPRDAMALDEPMMRVAFLLGQRKLVGRAPLVPVPTGAVWIDGRAGEGERADLVVRAAVAHAMATDTDAPGHEENVHIDYRAAVTARRVIALDGGFARAHDATWRRRVRYVGRHEGKPFDYTVEAEQRADLTMERVEASPTPGPRKEPGGDAAR